MDFVKHEPLATYEKWLLALLLVVVMVHVYFEMITWHSNGKYYKPWGQSTPIVIVSTKKHIAELSEAACLSQRAVYADMFGFKHTMDKLEHNTSDHKVIRTRLYSRVLQVMGPDHLNSLYPHLVIRLKTDLDKLMRHESSSQDGISLPVARTARQLASRMMSLIFFGEALSSDAAFSDALLRYPQDMVKCMGAFQIVPSILSPFIHAIITKRGKAMHIIQNRLLGHLNTHHSKWIEPENTKQLTILYNMTDVAETSDYWNPSLLAQSLLGIWFAASHQPWMNLHFIILEMCVRKECQAAIRRELGQSMPLDYKRLEQLPLLDSFIKETVRLNPLDKLAIRRKALESYTFSDGSISVPAGATVCTSAYDQMHNPEVYPNPNSFEATRYLSNDDVKQSRFTDISESFPVWGYGSLACPGRIHASLVIKLVLSELLLNYDLSLENEKARTRWSWETFTMPYESTRVILKRRADSRYG
ncbi:cytochrome P450 [Xylaria palmicola]|nr:cytochrome P450 [Xylaria palmicola]